MSSCQAASNSEGQQQLTELLPAWSRAWVSCEPVATPGCYCLQGSPALTDGKGDSIVGVRESGLQVGRLYALVSFSDKPWL